jgi:hypothetical protein
VVLIKTPNVSSRRFYLWFAGSNVKTSANEGMYSSPKDWFSAFLSLGETAVRSVKKWPFKLFSNNPHFVCHIRSFSALTIVDGSQ